jgi:hypothetical protein
MILVLKYKLTIRKYKTKARLTPVILAFQWAEIKRIEV